MNLLPQTLLCEELASAENFACLLCILLHGTILVLVVVLLGKSKLHDLTVLDREIFLSITMLVKEHLHILLAACLKALYNWINTLQPYPSIILVGSSVIICI